MLHQRSKVPARTDSAEIGEAALRVAAHRMFDLDHVGTPVGEHRARGRDVGELGNLDDSYPSIGLAGTRTSRDRCPGVYVAYVKLSNS